MPVHKSMRHPQLLETIPYVPRLAMNRNDLKIGPLRCEKQFRGTLCRDKLLNSWGNCESQVGYSSVSKVNHCRKRSISDPLNKWIRIMYFKCTLHDPTYIKHYIPVIGITVIQSSPLVRSAFCPMKIDHTNGLTLYPGY